MIDFNSVPLDLRTPGAYAEIDASRALKGLPRRTPRVLLVGGRTAAGSIAANVLTRVHLGDDAPAMFGRGSILANMVAAFLKASLTVELWAVAAADDDAATAGTQTVTLTGTATAAGEFPLWVAGRRIGVPVAIGDTAATVAGKVNTEVNAIPDAPVTSGVAGAVVTLTARNKGVTGNSIDVRAVYQRDDLVPAGLTVAIATGVTGATDPNIDTALAGVGDEPFDLVVSAYAQGTNVTKLAAWLDSRWGPTRMLDGLGVMARRAAQGTLASEGAALNSEWISILGYKSAPQSPWEWAAAEGAIISLYGGEDPARPFQTLVLPGLLAPVEADRFTRSEREALLRDGISTYVVDTDGQVLIERPITTYQTNAAGFADTAFLDVNTVLTLAYIRWSLRVRIATKFPRHKLASDNAVYADGQAIVTPRVLRAELIAWARDLEAAGLMENVDQFKADLVVERDPTDPNRANALVPPDLVNQFRVFAAQIQYRL